MTVSTTIDTDVKEVYHEKPVIENTLKATAGFGGAGLVVAGFRNALVDKSITNIFSRTGSTITHFALLGGIFTATESITANFRQTNDMFNSAIAGCTTVLVAGVKAHSYPLALGACLGIGGIMSMYEFTGAWKGFISNKSEEEKREWRASIIRKQPKLPEDD
ncbi:7075_t:CDS:2 [Entrophospora sp. SA101]|nr:7075_t:CDS:2 [Entrophospora sp. SA101]CAJ0842808.1 4252_t:CDS:2 [Entrophospora sp. SA101]